VVTRQVHSGARHQSGQPGQKIQRLEDHVCSTVPVARTTMAGEPLDGTNDRSYWTAPLLGGEMLDSRKQDLEEALSLIVEQLESHAEFLKGFRLSSGSTSLAVGIFGSDNFGIELPPQLLGQLAALGIEFGLDVYPGAPHE
jgi:hypothetical protein